MLSNQNKIIINRHPASLVSVEPRSVGRYLVYNLQGKRKNNFYRTRLCDKATTTSDKMIKLLPFVFLIVFCQSQELDGGGDLDALLEHFAAQVTEATEPTPLPDVEIESMEPENARRRREAVNICTTKYGEIGNCVFYKTCDAKGESYGASFVGSTCSKWEICCALRDISTQLD